MIGWFKNSDLWVTVVLAIIVAVIVTICDRKQKNNDGFNVNNPQNSQKI